MIDHLRTRGSRGTSSAIVIVGGGAVALAVWAGGDHGWAIAAIAIYAVCAAVACIWAGGSGDVAAILRGAGDERQRSVEREALAITAQVMTVVAVVGAIVELGQSGNPGVYGLVCAVSGVAYALSWAVRRKHR
jgi:hypothetical protein